MNKIVLASGNKGKIAEFAQMLTHFNVEILPQSQFNVPDVAETGTTFVENAIIKARHTAKITGLPSIADDSGLEVDSLNGEPGIFSARFCGEHGNDIKNYQKLLHVLQNEKHRQARFQCVLVYMRHAADPTPIICQGSWEGSIAYQAKGDKGHGYDPIFIPENHLQTAAELSNKDKNELSHRGKALKLLINAMAEKGLLINE